VQKLREGGLVAILPDQKSDDVFVPFFGKTAGTVAGPAILALKTGAPIVPFFCPRLPNGTFRMVVGDEIDTHTTGDQTADVERIMTDINLAVEKIVREYPDQWLWLHDRWLIRPSTKRRRLPRETAPAAP
jgi:KDO2-lipid IV(A) lauroyltransferase